MLHASKWREIARAMRVERKMRNLNAHIAAMAD